MGNLDPFSGPMDQPTVAHPQPESCNLETRRPKFSGTEESPQGLFSVLFVVPTPSSVCTSLHQVEDVSQGPAGPAPTTA